MIPASEALDLPTAQLTDDQRVRVEKLEALIEAHVRNAMERRGCDFHTTETDNNVVAEINQRLKAAGWITQFMRLQEPNPLNRGAPRDIGFMIHLGPSDDAYKTNAKTLLS